MSCSDPTWINILSALLTPVIALVVGYVAWQQWRTNQKRLKLELFDRRYAVYQAARNLILVVSGKAGASDDDALKFRLKTRDSEFFLNDELTLYLNEMYTKVIEISALKRELESLPAGDEKSKKRKEFHELLRWILNQSDVLAEKFSLFLKLGH